MTNRRSALSELTCGSEVLQVVGRWIPPDEPSLARDLAGLDARGAGVDALRGPVHHGTHGLDVRVPAPLGAAVRVRDVVAEARPLAAHVAVGSHFDSPLPSR